MCPACLTNMVLVAAGATSTGGVTAFIASKFYAKSVAKQTDPEPNTSRGEQNDQNHDQCHDGQQQGLGVLRQQAQRFRAFVLDFGNAEGISGHTLFLAREFELMFANCEITLVQNLLDDVKTVLKFECDQIGLTIANFEKGRDF